MLALVYGEEALRNALQIVKPYANDIFLPSNEKLLISELKSIVFNDDEPKSAFFLHEISSFFLLSGDYDCGSVLID